MASESIVASIVRHFGLPMMMMATTHKFQTCIRVFCLLSSPSLLATAATECCEVGRGNISWFSSQQSLTMHCLTSHSTQTHKRKSMCDKSIWNEKRKIMKKPPQIYIIHTHITHYIHRTMLYDCAMAEATVVAAAATRSSHISHTTTQPVAFDIFALHKSTRGNNTKPDKMKKKERHIQQKAENKIENPSQHTTCQAINARRTKNMNAKFNMCRMCCNRLAIGVKLRHTHFVRIA